MQMPNKVIEVGAWCLENGHRALLKVTGGRYPKKVMGMEPVELFTIGRTSGKRRATMLTAPICDQDRVVVVASKGGHEDHPDWYKNLSANPGVEIAVGGGEPEAYVARTADAEEKAALWPTITKAYKGYEGYQRNTDRDIPVVICTPCGRSD